MAGRPADGFGRAQVLDQAGLALLGQECAKSG